MKVARTKSGRVITKPMRYAEERERNRVDETSLCSKVLLLKDAQKIKIKRTGKRHRDNTDVWLAANLTRWKHVNLLLVPLQPPNAEFDDCVPVACHNALVSFGINLNVIAVCNKYRRQGILPRKSALMDHRFITDIMSEFKNSQSGRNIFYSKRELLSSEIPALLILPIDNVASWEWIFDNFRSHDVVLIVHGFVDKKSDIGHAIALDFYTKVLYEGSNFRQAFNPGIAFELSLTSAKLFLKHPKTVYLFFPKADRTFTI